MINDFITMHKKSAHFERFMINDDKSFYHWYAILLADAEVSEDVGKDGVGGDFATGDFGKVVEALAEVFGDEVAGDVISYGMTYTGNGFEGVMEGFVMTKVGYDG